MKLIDKDALVAEIEKRISRNKKRKEWENIPEKRHQLIIEGQLLGEFKHFLDSLEVKEVDLEKEINNYIYTDNGRQRLALELDWKQCNITFNSGKLIDFAKHFFELGIAVSNKVQKGK